MVGFCFNCLCEVIPDFDSQEGHQEELTVDKMMIKVFCLVLLFSLNCSLDFNHGITMRVNQKCIDYVKNFGMEFLKKKLMNQMLPDMTGSTTKFGKGEFLLSGIKVEELQLPKSAALPKAPANIVVSIEDASVNASGNWKMHHWLVNNSGKFVLNLSNVAIKARLSTFWNDFRRPSVLLDDCQSSVGKAKVHFSGKRKWLYNLFSGFLDKPIRTNLNAKLCPKVKDIINSLNRKLDTFLVVTKPDAYIDIHYSLLEKPKTTDRYIDLYLMGKARPAGNPVEYALSPKPIPLPDDNNYMLYVGFPTDFFHTLAASYFMANALERTITPKDFPEAFWLSTDGYNHTFSEITLHYPEACPMEMIVMATQAPAVSLTPNSLTLTMFGFLKAYALLPDSLEPLFSMYLEADLCTHDLQMSQLNLTSNFILTR
uniref:Bactericidal permeability-increasing protein n=1 Tax=Geotrypetes seraphini TaxID=260995 RepID=A0A6P8SIE7_GEOSA|nr:BPI fold-containing family C protein-like [Geotrypetes seraphini]